MATYEDDTGLGALNDATRRAIVLSLAARPQAVVELATELPISRPAVSQHLKVLKAAGLVTERAAGNRRIYQVNEAGLAARKTAKMMSGWLCGHFPNWTWPPR